ncbi:MAG: DNA repair protein RadC [Patescibacteria group bacterium]
MRKIKSLPISLRPREKLLKYGPDALTTQELIAAILVTGTKSESVSILAKKITKILKHHQELSKKDLEKIGLGKSKIAQILASLELSKRLKDDQPTSITTPEQIYAQSQEIINSGKETLLCFYLNARGEILKKEIIAVGSVNGANALPREIYSYIKELPITDIILVHNHPSGILEPSKTDIVFTKRVDLAGKILGINLLDHLIVSPKGWKQIKF